MKVSKKVLCIQSSKAIAFSVGEDELLNLYFYIIGGVSVCCDLTVRLAGKFSQANIVGYILAYDMEKIQIATTQIHEGKSSKSHLELRSVIGGSSEVLYKGNIIIQKSADDSQAFEKNISLLVSDKAHSVSKPLLEIMTDNVTCSHGSVTKPVSEEELWYLSTRGVGRTEAVGMLIDGFVGEGARMAPAKYQSLWKKSAEALLR